MAYPWELDEEIEQRLADNNPISGGEVRRRYCGVASGVKGPQVSAGSSL